MEIERVFEAQSGLDEELRTLLGHQPLRSRCTVLPHVFDGTDRTVLHERHRR
ncbi:hypothetical protein [Halalkalicoccus salilacus]|uniref:hypothetical protein n=1 Tax=Halalkalicoccus sp. GCM10025704 TaxID=3252662 RepID=UPI0036242DF7